MTMQTPQDLGSALIRLQQLGVRLVVLRYDGTGDSGQIEEVCAYRVAEGITEPKQGYDSLDWFDGELVDLPPDLDAFLMSYGYDQLASNFGGWEDNDGSFGKIKLVGEPAYWEGTIEHNWRTTTEAYATLELPALDVTSDTDPNGL
jgi:hypothetical protein